MATYETPGAWEAAQGGGGTPVAFHGTPTGVNPSSVVTGTVLDNCLFAGLKVSDPSTKLTSIVDDGGKCSITITSGTYALHNGHGPLGNVGLIWPNRLIGDFEIVAMISGTLNTASIGQVAFGAWNGDTVNECGADWLRYGAWNNTSADHGLYTPCKSTHMSLAGAGLQAWATPRWVRYARVGETVILSDGGTGGTPSWTDYGPRPWQFGGSNPVVGMWFYTANAGDVFHFKDFQITGEEAP